MQVRLLTSVLPRLSPRHLQHVLAPDGLVRLYIGCNQRRWILTDSGQQASASTKFNNILRGCKRFDLHFQKHAGFGVAGAVVQRRSIITEDHETTALTLWKDLKHIKSSPLPALVLGFSGLIPFVAPPVYMISAQTFMPQLIFAELAYGACILSFLGGVRWGFVIPEESAQRPDWQNLGYSVAPSLIAWVGLLMPVPLGILTVMGGIAGAAYFDATMGGYPRWFKGLRFVLSLGAVLSLWTAYLCQYVIRGKESEPPQDLKGD